MEFIALSGPEADHALEVARDAFPTLIEWESVNEDDGEHFGFCAWGAHVLDDDTYNPRVFYVTLERSEMGWRAHLTIGQHAYMWTSADFGDAYLASTEACASIEAAVAALKAEIASLFNGLMSQDERSQ